MTDKDEQTPGEVPAGPTLEEAVAAISTGAGDVLADHFGETYGQILIAYQRGTVTPTLQIHSSAERELTIAVLRGLADKLENQEEMPRSAGGVQ